MSVIKRKGKTTVDESQIKLGDEYRDTITGFAGIAVATHHYLHGCTRVTLQTLAGDDIKEFNFDAPALIATKKPEEKITSKKTGGPRSVPGPRPT